MNDDLNARSARLIAASSFTEADLVKCRATALELPENEVVNENAMYVTTGFVLTYNNSSKNSSSYRLIIDGREVELDSSKQLEAISVGAAYRVYFTPHGKRLHAIEAVGAWEAPDAVANAARAVGLNPADDAARRDPRVVARLREELLRGFSVAFDFTSDDLTENRKGVLTPREAKKLRTEALGCFGCAGFFVLLGGLIAAKLLGDSIAGLCIAGLVTLLIVVLLIRAGVRRRRDATAGRVVSADTRLVLQDRHGSERNLVAEGGPSFGVELSAFSLRGHQPLRLAQVQYRVYYAPNEAEIMSMEPLDLSPLLALPDQ